MAESKQNERYEQRRLEVLLAAARTFNRKGFHTATLDDVAEELGVTKPALYYYARSKDELLSACGEMALHALQLALDKSNTAARSAVQRLRKFFLVYAEIICSDFGRCLVLTLPHDLAPINRKKNLAARRALNSGVRELVREGVAEGALRPCDERALVIVLFDTFNGLSRWFDPKGPKPLEAVVEQYLGILLHGVAREVEKAE